MNEYKDYEVRGTATVQFKINDVVRAKSPDEAYNKAIKTLNTTHSDNSVVRSEYSVRELD